MHDLSADKGRTSETSKTFTAIRDPQWKWELLMMDFISGLPTTSKGNNAIWVIVDRLTKSAHFIPLKTGKNLQMLALAHTFINEIVSRHGQLASITSDRTAVLYPDFGKPYMSLWA